MITFYNSRFVKFQYYESEEILQQTWNYTHHRNHLHFYQSIHQFLYIIDEYKTKKALIDFSNFTFCLDAQSQKWIEKNLFVKLAKKNVSKVALVKSKDHNTQDSLQTLFSVGMEQQPIIALFFDTLCEAKQWLTAKPVQGTSARRQKLAKKVSPGV
ncbi:hypothetical protein [Microscilla marina]|uniref:STAS/SEC14 domain-containing protein n=1 Tax=Microscilla marina ATCC 23134 TaxID=313606 RepID=A1ZP93_MICM2|nr:hypothetical protein [Microscilla marina]EAY27885.1 hypothetical protein M23134_00326 [Microscilla marina ATCC 23134]